MSYKIKFLQRIAKTSEIRQFLQRRKWNNRDTGSFFLFPAVIFCCLDDRIQEFQLLVGGAVQLFDVLGDHIGVDFGGSFGQLLLSFDGFGIVHDQIDRRHFSDNGHLLEIICKR